MKAANCTLLEDLKSIFPAHTIKLTSACVTDYGVRIKNTRKVGTETQQTIKNVVLPTPACQCEAWG
jgi:hypothetical protein